MTRVKVAGGGYYDLLPSNARVGGYLGIGSLSVPANTLAGDITGTRLHVGTDAAFTSGFALETNNSRVKVGGTIANSGANDTAFLFQVNFTGAGDSPFGMQVQPSFTPSASVGATYGQFFQNVLLPPTSVTITFAVAFYAQMIYHNTAGAVTTGAAVSISAPTIVGALKPTNNFGLDVGNQGAASITLAAAIRLALPTGATGNYYMSLDTATAEVNVAIGSSGYIPVVIGGVARKIYYT